MFSVKQSKDILGAYCVFWVISMLVTVLTLIVKEPTSFAIFKIITAVVYGLHGAMGLEVFDELRQSGGLDNPEWNLFGIGQGFHGIFVGRISDCRALDDGSCFADCYLLTRESFCSSGLWALFVSLNHSIPSPRIRSSVVNLDFAVEYFSTSLRLSSCLFLLSSLLRR